MARSTRSRPPAPTLSLLALAGALFGVISLTHARPAGEQDLVLNVSTSSSPTVVSPIVSP